MPDMNDEKIYDDKIIDAQDDVEKSSSSDEPKDKVAVTTLATPIPAIAPATDLPDGGARAWLQVLGSFIAFGNLWGFAFAFGTFQSYYTIEYLPHESASAISWIGTVSTFLLIVSGIISGPLFDLGYFRAMLICGAMMETLSVFLMSVSTKYWQLMLTQGVMQGLFCGLLYLPGLALVGRAFKRHRAIALGITTCGAPVGGIIYTLVFQQLIPKYGFGWTVRIMGFLMLGTYLISFPLTLWGVHNLGDLAVGSTRKLFDRAALTNLPFWSFTLSNFLIFMGYMIPFVFIPSFGQRYLGMSQSSSLYVAMIAQASSIVGRLAVGYTASKIGGLIPWIVCALTSSICCLAWTAVRTEGSFIAISALYGCFSGALIPLQPSVFAAVCTDPTIFGTRLGMSQALNSVGSLIGAPIAGALTTTNADGKVNYLGLQVFGGVVMLTGGLNIISLWYLLLRQRNGGSKWI